MIKLNALVLTAALLSLAGCVDVVSRDNTPRIPEYQRIINDWHGHPVSELMSKWGPPDRVFTTGGKEYHVHEITSTVRGTASRYSSYGTSSYQVLDCTYTFEVLRGIIVGGNAVGRDCKK